LRLPEAELNTFLNQKAKLVAVINEPTTDPIMVYRVDWKTGMDD
jgi:hypothetical protein